MLEKMKWRFLIIWTVLLCGSTDLLATQGQQGSNAENLPQFVVESGKEGWFRNYLVPCIPVISVALATVGGALINHYYWKKREQAKRKDKLADERIASYLNFCKYNLEFNACTDHIMRLEDKKTQLKEQGNLRDTQQAIRELEVKRIDALKGLRQGISYARIFFESNSVDKSINGNVALTAVLRNAVISGS